MDWGSPLQNLADKIAKIKLKAGNEGFLQSLLVPGLANSVPSLWPVTSKGTAAPKLKTFSENLASPCIFTIWCFNLLGHATEQGTETELWGEEAYSVQVMDTSCLVPSKIPSSFKAAFPYLNDFCAVFFVIYCKLYLHVLDNQCMCLSK